MNPLLIGAGLQLAGGLLGGDPSSAGVDAAKSNKRLYESIALPDIEKMKLLLEQYGSAGNLTPEQMQAMSLSEQDQLENINLDPRLRQAQMDALSFMEKTGQGDLTPSERAQTNNLRRQVEADNQSRMQALLQQQDARGVGSSDMALASRMLEAQGSANRQAQSTDDISAAAFQRALQSMATGANLASGMESADYDRASNLSEAQRNRELMNFQNQQNISNANTQARNAAQEFNLQNSQNVMNQNTAMRNMQQQYNKELEQRNFENQMRRASGIADANSSVGSAQMGQDQARKDQIGGVTKGLGGLVGSYMTPTSNVGTAQVKAGVDLNDQLNSFFKKKATT